MSANKGVFDIIIIMNGISYVTILYGFIVLISIVFLICFIRALRDKIDRNGVIALFSLILINLGYFLLSVSKNIAFAIFCNRLSYFGSILLIMEMYFIVGKFCNINNSKAIAVIVKLTSILIFALVLTGGTSIKLYYESIDISIVSNFTKLVKVYGRLHYLYLVYVLIMFFLMLSILIHSILRKSIQNSINPTILILLVTENIFVWIIEKFVRLDFELLSVSYLITEMILLMIYKNKEEYSKLNEKYQKDFAKENKSTVKLITEWKDIYRLTDRELEVLSLLLNNRARSDIAKDLYISEHTVKKYTSNIYEKLNVKSRNDLLYKLNEELEKK